MVVSGRVVVIMVVVVRGLLLSGRTAALMELAARMQLAKRWEKCMVDECVEDVDVV